MDAAIVLAAQKTFREIAEESEEIRSRIACSGASNVHPEIVEELACLVGAMARRLALLEET